MEQAYVSSMWLEYMSTFLNFEDEKSLVFGNDRMAECHSPTTWVSEKGHGCQTAHVKQSPLEDGWLKFV